MRHRSQQRMQSALTNGESRPVRAARAALSTTVSGMAAAAGVTPHVVRYYARIGLLKPGRDPANNYKRFTEQHLRRVLFIRQAKALGFTLGDIKRIVDHANDGHSPCPEVRDIIRRRIEENRARLQELQRLQQRMEEAVRRWEMMPNRAPDGHGVCHLIESIEVD